MFFLIAIHVMHDLTYIEGSSKHLFGNNAVLMTSKSLCIGSAFACTA